jgi:hypothetical protein
MRGHLLDLTPRTRIVFAVSFVLCQVALLATGPLRPDGVFAFQMFNESSRLEITLHRRVRTRRGRLVLQKTNGEWTARGPDGKRRTFRWSDRVRDRVVGRLGQSVHASYGLAAQLLHLQAALDDVARNIPEDTETVALVAEVNAVYNGRDRVHRFLEARR